MNINFFKKIKLPKIARQHPFAFWITIVFHIGLVIGLLFSNVQRWEIPKQIAKSNVTFKAVTINLTEIKKEKQRLIKIKQKREKRFKALQRAEKKVENERYKEQQRLKKLKVKVKQERKAKTIAERKRKEAESKSKQALKKKKLAEKEALEAEKKKQAIEKLRQVEAKKFKKEQDNRSLKKEIQAEEDQDRQLAQENILNELKFNYINQIALRIKEKWRYQGAKDSWSCDVEILQDLNGQVKSVNLRFCNVDDSAKAQSFKDSIERAVYKASPLPYAPDKSVFDAQVLFHFKVN
ncbi:Cell division and transport-associated protein TolA [Candidatus Ruthia magnifica str. Cm (Calyptogena magnifica)]|uniref:Cell division and transport-associated protein TolA n=1 Tax=Ruthia magnifica subsp. Calyptogena magnifica TaxID=413404 RepID=A1AWZ7_RUTMC|nr:cell envelope integrity protein TolA [Candidatus Ruthturnera calyptogenae]ABL02454.1 Cell division and transport-associated protein TolA [Candidatus Ruthia magnifica str. Cm (Calyptogena magnifica)]